MFNEKKKENWQAKDTVVFASGCLGKTCFYYNSDSEGSKVE